MSAGTPSLVIIGAFVAGLAIGWFGRGWFDGSTISATAAQESAQSAVNASVKAASQIERASSVADAARRAASKAVEVRYVDRGCPPGTGAVSADLAAGLRADFGEDSGEATDSP